MSLDLVIRGGRVVDPAHGIDRVLDLGIERGTIVQTGDVGDARRTVDAAGCDVLPGLVDLHVHCSSEFSGAASHAMLARAGVTTALDVAGPVADVMQLAATCGAGLTVGCLDALVPGATLTSSDPRAGELAAAIARAKRAGACGVKILGGHFPLTPGATRAALGIAADSSTWIAVHCGTTTAGSDLAGLGQLLELRDGHPVHVAHINSYCRGKHEAAAVEAQRAADLLAAARNVFSESYVARINATWGRCVDQVPASERTLACLASGGFEPSESGLARAIEVGYAHVHVLAAGDVRLEAGMLGLRAWRDAGTLLPVSFRVNDLPAAVVLAAARKPDGSFAVDAWATDGGGIPRNNAVAVGYSLVRLGVISVPEFVTKTSLTPAHAFGLTTKGHLGAGADADVAVVDPITGVVRHTVARGEVIVHDGSAVRAQTAWLTVPDAREAAQRSGLDVVELSSPLPGASA